MTLVRRRTLAAAAAAVLILVPDPTPAAAEEKVAARRIELGAVNSVMGSSVGYVPVSIPKDVVIDAREPNAPGESINPDIRIEGSGRFVGIALVEDPYPGGRVPHRFFLAGRFNGCDEEGCKRQSTSVETMYDFLDEGGPRLRLEAGDYRLYLLADGGPVRARFRLHGLSGRSQLDLTHSAELDIQTPAERIDASVNGTRMWSAGSSFAGGQVGFSLSWLEVNATDFTDMQIGMCQYNALEPPPDAIAYGPHCSRLTPLVGSGGSVTFDKDIEEDTFTLLASFGYHDNRDATTGTPNLRGEHGLGAWISSPQDFEVLPLRSLFLTIR